MTNSTRNLTRNITVNPKPAAATAIVGSNQGCQGYTEIYTVDPINFADSYLWSIVPPEAATTLQNENTVTVLWSDMYEGTAIMKVCGVNACGEGLWSEEFPVMVQNCTGIAENSRNASLNIYPNPASGNFTVEFNASGLVNLNLINTLGEVVYQLSNIEANGFCSKNITVNGMREGIYYLKIEGVTTTINKKVVISR